MTHMKNIARNIFAMNPVTTENTGEKRDKAGEKLYYN